MINEKLMEIYRLLDEHFGPQNWWPGETTFEIVVGAILTQNTNWTNVEKAIANLKAADVLSPDKLHNMSDEDIAPLIKPAGYFNIKAARLKHFLNFLYENFDGSLDAMGAREMHSLREDLLAVKGIGPETADSILLYAFGMPVFVVDAYTARIFARHLLIEPNSDYHQIQEFFHDSLPNDVELYNQFHALIVCAGKTYCKPKPNCNDCPLNGLKHEVNPANW